MAARRHDSDDGIVDGDNDTASLTRFRSTFELLMPGTTYMSIAFACRSEIMVIIVI